MGIQITSVEEAIEDNGLKFLVYGLAGAGKTRLSATTGQPTIIISAEGGLLSLKKLLKQNPGLSKLLSVITVKTIEEFEEAYQMFEDSPERLSNWIILDSISEIAERILSEEKASNKDGRAAYGNLTDRVLILLRKFRDLPLYNVLMTAKMVRSEDQEGKTYYMPLFPGKGISNNIPYLFDEVFALRVEEDEDGNKVRLLQTALDTKYYAKDRSDELDEFEAPDMKAIFEKIHGYEEVNFELDEDSKAKYTEIKNARDVEASENVTDEITWWMQQSSGNVMEVEADTDVSEFLEDDDIIQITETHYNAIQAGEEYDPESEVEYEAADDNDVVEESSDVPNPEDEEGELVEEASEEIIGSKTQYWRHDPSGQCLMTEEGDDISGMVNNHEVIEIDEDEFTEWKNQEGDLSDQSEQEAEEEAEPEPEPEPVKKAPAKETSLQRAQREIREANAKKK